MSFRWIRLPKVSPDATPTRPLAPDSSGALPGYSGYRTRLSIDSAGLCVDAGAAYELSAENYVAESLFECLSAEE